MRDIFKLLRIRHWIKNILIFVPVVFHGSLLASDYAAAFWGFCSFSLISSAVYIINDIRDVEKDRRHEVKKNRPIASGRVSVQMASVLAVTLAVVSVGLNVMRAEYRGSTTFLLLFYFGMNLLYSFGLKDKAIIDVVILSAGFVVRILYGSEVTAIEPSDILLLTVMVFSLYMGLGKRRNEKRKIRENTREVLERYTDDFLDKNMYMCLGLGIVFYTMWALSIGGLAVWTVAIVIVICMRYNLILENDSYGDPVDVLLLDKMLLGLVIIFAVLLLLTVYMG